MGRMARHSLRSALLLAALLAIAPSPASAAARPIHHGDPFKAFPSGKARPFAHAAALDPLFSSTWPCDPQTVDLGQIHNSNAPEVKVLYAATGDNFATYKNMIQAD